MSKRTRVLLSFLVMILGLFALIVISAKLGSLKLSYREIFDGLFVKYDDRVAAIYDLRFPRIIIAILSGAAIAVSGAILQAVLKNPLADPSIIGISSGASFFAVATGLFFPTLYFYIPIFAFIGGLLALFIIYFFSFKNKLSTVSLILLGVALNIIFIAFTDLFTSIGGAALSGAASVLKGNISMKTWSDVKLLSYYSIPFLVLPLFFTNILNVMQLDDKSARSVGINVNLYRFILALFSTILASISAAIVGAIPFTGLIIPHISRKIVGSNYKLLIPFSMVSGSFIMLLADTLGRTVISPIEISSSILMSIIGGPIFIALSLRGKRI